MSEHAKRLRWIRESLRRPDGRPVDRQALCLALGWPAQRWKNLESELPWGEGSQQWVREGLLALVARTTLPEEAGQRAVAFVLEGAKAKPWTSPPEWRDGQCPQGKRVGRPPSRFDDDPVKRAMRPPAIGASGPSPSLLEAILRAFEAKRMSLQEAIDALGACYLLKKYGPTLRLPPGVA